ncbi:MAG: lactate utilization protein [Desulfobacteraceae bacterium]|nr:lactate utilization protein [Desulfobacteraceae bacterium]
MVSAIVHGVTGMEDALEKTIQICREKLPCENLMPADSNSSGKKNLAAPNMDEFHYGKLQMLCEKHGITLIKEGVRNFPGGIDMGVTMMDYGIAETGTLVLNSDSEETRLATMLCETHVAIVDKAHIRKTALEMSDELNEMTVKPSSYTAFITGASRTADIERVLALGVHGPLELHIMLIEGD